MQAEKSELQKIIQTLWSSELYKIILSNPTGEGTYRKIVLNRQKKGWQAEQYTEKQVFHENLPEGKVQDYLMANMSSAFRQCGAWDGTFEHTVRISKKGKVTGMKKRTAQTEAPMIRAVRSMIPASAKKQARAEVDAIEKEFGLQPTLDTLLHGKEA